MPFVCYWLVSFLFISFLKWQRKDSYLGSPVSFNWGLSPILSNKMTLWGLNSVASPSSLFQVNCVWFPPWLSDECLAFFILPHCIIWERAKCFLRDSVLLLNLGGGKRCKGNKETSFLPLLQGKFIEMQKLKQMGKSKPSVEKFGGIHQSVFLPSPSFLPLPPSSPLSSSSQL